jgi:exosome complex exonuclease RRP6
MEKPQLRFEHVSTNQEQRPFRPLLLTKPHASMPLDPEPVPVDDASQSQYAAQISLYSCLGFEHKPISLYDKKYKLKPIDSDPPCRYSHPYQLEIEQYRYPSSVYARSDPIPYHPFDSTTAIFVDSEEILSEMLEELKNAKEIAIDLEHHDQRSYIGLVSLMQISTRDQDWIVDTLKPWRRKLSVLNEVFADPSIVKVLHGAYMDIVWLQRDLGLYIVGLFDTHYAARALGYPGGSLAFLLKKFANVDAQKQYQMADWRIRPLPQELFGYARSDTHYLLYIYDCMRNELIERSNLALPNHEGDKLWDVLQKSSETALQRYEHPVYDTKLGQGQSGWYKMLSRTPALFTKEQFSVFRAVHKWRDDVAREEDDSVHYVMPNHQVFSIAREMPSNRAAVLSIAQPTTQTIRLRVDELVGVISKGKEDGKNGSEMLDILNKVEPHTGTGVVKKEPQGHSVAAYVPTTASNTSVNGSTLTNGAILPLRSSTSAFWGPAFDSSAHNLGDRRDISNSPAGIELSVPMPALTAEVFADPADAAAYSQPLAPAPEPQQAPAPARDDDDDDVFVLKELSKKRKRLADIDGVAAQSDEVAIPDEEAERLREKAERKRARKEAKRAEKRARREAEAGGDEDLAQANGSGGDDEQPFDYASAPSILNPPRESKEEMRARKKKEVNPYAKSLDAPKGLPRVQKERAGRTMTYK